MDRLLRLAMTLVLVGALCAAQPSVAATDAKRQPPAPSGDSAKDKQDQTVVGTIESVEEDDDGNVTQVALWDDDESYYLIVDAGKGHDLKQLVGSRVKATGSVREDDNGDLVLTVTSYVVLQRGKKNPPDDGQRGGKSAGGSGRDNDRDGT